MSSFCTAKKFQHICISRNVNFNESLTNDVVSSEQLGPVWYSTKCNMSRNTVFPTRLHVRQAMTQTSLRIPCRLIRVFAIRLKTLSILGYLQSSMWILWSDCADALAERNLRWAHKQSCRKCWPRLILTRNKNENRVLLMSTLECAIAPEALYKRS